MKLQDDTKRNVTGNDVRTLLNGAGIPAPNKALVDLVAPVVLTDDQGGTLRQWKYSRAELMPIIKQIESDFIALNNFVGTEMFTEHLEKAKAKFLRLLAELDKKKTL